MRGRVLVLGDDSRSALAVVRSLGRRDIRVTVGIQDSTSIVPASRYATRAVVLPGPDRPPEIWADAVRAVLMRDRYDLLIPTADDALVPMVARRAQFDALVRCAIPDEHGFELTYHKDRTIAMAQQLGIPVPDTLVIATRDDWDRCQLSSDLSFPLVVKPGSSKVWSEGRRNDLAVTTVHDAHALRARVLELLPLTPVLIQSFVHGSGVGQEFLADQGEVLLAFQHERIHEPPDGGGSSYRRSVPVDPALLACSTVMLRHMRWTGVAMVEFKRDPATGRFALMEINGRFWGSLPLAVAAGVDFPYHLYRLLVDGERATPAPYHSNLYGRNLSRDLEWTIQSGHAWSIRGAIREFGHVITGRERWDTLTLDDLRPFLTEARQMAASLMRRVRALLRRVARARVRQSAPWRAWQRIRLRRLLRRRPAILLVCKGNICRSPFAERCLRGALAGRAVSGIRVGSAGLYPASGRPSPTEARLAASDFGVALDQHRSVIITPELVDDAGAILCMESSEIDALRERFPHASGKMMLLGAFAPGSTADLEDPWGSPVDGFRNSYSEIRSSVDAVVAALSKPL